MKKKILCFIGCAIMIGSLPALAADESVVLMSTKAAPNVVQISSQLIAGHIKPQEEEAVPPDAEGELSFANLSGRMKENYKSLRALEENIAAIESIDYDKMGQDMREGLSDIADLQWLNMVYIKDSYTGATLEQSYDSLKSAYDDLKEGKTQKNNADQIKMLKNMQNQVIMAGESLYVTIQDLNRTNAQLQRQLESMERTVQEMELRYKLGQISALQLEQVKAGRTSLISGKETLEMNLRTCNMQMQMMVGVPMTGELKLYELPKVTEEQLSAMDLEKDLITAKAASYELLDAKNTLDDAKEDYDDARDEYKSNSYQLKAAQHVWQGAQYQYEATVEQFEGNFRTLYLQVGDYKQVLDAAKVSLELQKSTYKVEELKYQQGNLAYNKLLDAKDEVTAAEDSVISAEVNLFSAYNNYRWAVDHGILN